MTSDKIKLIEKESYFHESKAMGERCITKFDIEYQEGYREIAEQFEKLLQLNIPEGGYSWWHEYRVTLVAV